MTSPDIILVGSLPCEIRLGDVLDRLREMPDNSVDCVVTSPAGRKADNDGRIRTGKDDRTFTQKPFSTIQGSLKPKDLCMVPNRLAIARERIAKDWMGPDELKSHRTETAADAGPLFSLLEPMEVCSA